MKIEKCKNWYKKGNAYDTVLFIPVTKNSTLKKEMQAYVKKEGGKIKVIERAGRRIGKLLQVNDPFKEKQCNKNNCMLCKSSGKGNCRSTGIVYEISCEGECPFTYHGQTSSNAFTRGLKHVEDLIKKRDKSLWKHCQNEHNGQKCNFGMKIVSQYRNDATKRQIAEAIWIRNTNPATTMNERSEWNDIRIPRIEINN